MNTPEAAKALLAEAELLLPVEVITAAYERLAARIEADYAGVLPLILCVMNGGLYATSEITQRLKLPFELDYLHATRYRPNTRPRAIGNRAWFDSAIFQ